VGWAGHIRIEFYIPPVLGWPGSLARILTSAEVGSAGFWVEGCYGVVAKNMDSPLDIHGDTEVRTHRRGWVLCTLIDKIRVHVPCGDRGRGERGMDVVESGGHVRDL